MSEQATKLIKEGEILPWVDRDAFQKEVLRRQLAVEEPHLNTDEIVFLDRGLFDGEAYYLCDQMPSPEIFTNLPSNRYAMALVIEALPFFDNNGVRFENLEFTHKITPVIESCYTMRDIPARRIPALPPIARVEFLLEQVAHVTGKPASALRPAVSTVTMAPDLNLVPASC